MSSSITKASLGQNGMRRLPASPLASGVDSALVEKLARSSASVFKPSTRQVASHASRSKSSSLAVRYCGDGVRTGIGDAAGDIDVSASSRHNGSAMAAADGGGAVPRRPLRPRVVGFAAASFVGVCIGLRGVRGEGGNERQRRTSSTDELRPVKRGPK
eukprot:CAMPEP_0172699386 /NCGR_PEP_ID=MMETSP1074-20121228/30143_1 /TAXON_ID=2916 /ORGANISM="Ceratium fusus, Strain PA161109" /LENGTH=157 /DNA_ID=CAMNT_0013520579 /DNA_START=54 /DNA_END=527 /DNA_ORIENTATION=-